MATVSTFGEGASAGENTVSNQAISMPLSCHIHSIPQRLAADPSTQGRASCRGFTLVELLVSLVLLGLMFTLLTSSIGFGTKVWSEHESESSEVSHVMVVENLLRRLISEARPVAMRATREQPWHINFAGEKNAIRFSAPMIERLSTGGFYEITIAVGERSGSKKTIEMSWRLPSQSAEQMGAVLFEGEVNLEFAYFGSQQVGAPPRWYPEWNFQRELPKLILTRLTLGKRRWPDLIVAPKVQTIALIQPSLDL